MGRDRNIRGYGCSECGWVFTASGPLVGETLDEMKRLYESQRDKEFAAHICTQHLKSSDFKSK
jgi:hypothetical protein